MSEYIKDESVSEEGPWHLYYDNGKVSGIGSHDFTHDVMFGMTGDFGGPENRLNYGNEIVRRLNAYGKAVEPVDAAYTFEALRTLVDLLDHQRGHLPEEEYKKLEDVALRQARYALQGIAHRRGRAIEKKIDN